MATVSTKSVVCNGDSPATPREQGQSTGNETRLAHQRLWGSILASAVLAAGMALVPLRVTGLRLTELPGDEIDSHFNLCVLEHGWQWLSGKRPRFWDAPFFYPQPNVLAYSDCHLGTLPIYAAFRGVGLDRETAFQCWFLSLFALNYAACLWALRRWRLSWTAASAGAYLFAFALPVVMQLGHVQLLPRFLVPPAAYFGVQLCRGGRMRDGLGLGTCLVWQCYATLYIAYFLLLFLAVFLPIYAVFYWKTELSTAVRRAGWQALLSAARRSVAGGSWGKLLARAAIFGGCCLALLPLLRPYLEMSRQRGGRTPLEILCLLPRPMSWVNPPAGSLCWGRWHCDADPRFFPGEHYLFLGVLPPFLLALALLGLFSRRTDESRRLAAAAALSFAVLLLLTLNVRGFSPYLRLISLPGVSAIRGVTRIVLVLLFPTALTVACGIALLQHWIARKRGIVPALVIAVALLMLVIVDQTMDAAAASRWTKRQCQDRVADLVAEVLRRDPAARLFVDVRANGRGSLWEEDRQHLTAMAAAQVLGIATLNGYSGWTPQGWSAFQRWQQLDAWKTTIVNRVGEATLRKRVPGYARNGFEGLLVVGDLGSIENEEREK